MTNIAGNNSVTRDGRTARAVRIAFDVAARSHTGKVKKTNQDHFLVVRLAKTFKTLATNLPDGTLPHRTDETGYGMLVADGVGGSSAGGLASRVAITAFVNILLHTPEWTGGADESDDDPFMERTTQCFQQVDAALAAQIAMQPELAGMGTTMTMGYSLGDQLYVAHVGDSRAYLFRQGELHRLTNDHTVAAALAARGETFDGADAGRPRMDLLTSALGGTIGLSVDVQRLQLADGDRLLLCTDGLTGMLNDDEIAQVLNRANSPEAVCDALIGRSLARGGSDNVTVIVAKYGIPTAASTSQFSGRWSNPLADRGV